MEKLMRFSKMIVFLLTIMIVVSCDPFGAEDPVASLVLVPLTSESLNKAFTDNAGQMWLPESELSNVLSKPSVAGIDYGEVKATRTLQYVIMNIGNQDVFNVNFTANDLFIYPGTIGLVQASEPGTQISALPIVNIVKEHVIPVDGAGALLDMEIGPFTDSLKLNYSYVLDGDTVDVNDGYDVVGTKMGAVVDILFSNLEIEKYEVSRELNVSNPYASWSNWLLTSFYPFSQEDLDTSVILNSGNVNINISIVDWYSGETVLDTLLTPGSSIGGNLLRDNPSNTTNGNVVLVGKSLNQPYLIKVAGEIITKGYHGVAIWEQ